MTVRQHLPAVRSLLLSAVSLTLLVAGCVMPGEFDRPSNACEGQRFDSVVRDAYCSGSYEMRELSGGPSALTADDAAEPLFDLRAGWLTSVQKLSEGQLTIRIFEHSGEALTQRFNETIHIDGVGADSNISSLATLSVSDAGVGEGVAKVAFIINDDRLAIVTVEDPVWKTRQKQGGEVLEPVPELWIKTRSEIAAASETLATSPCGEEMTFSDLAVVDRGSRLLVAAGCALLAFDVDSASAKPALEALGEAHGVAVDSDNHRLFVAAGRSGLRIRATTEVAAVPEGESNTLDDYMAPTGVGEDTDEWLDLGDLAEIDDPVDGVTANVTHVDFQGGRVLYINQATSADGLNNLSYLVSGRIGDASNLVERFSTPFPYDDFSVIDRGGSVDYTLVPLMGASVAVLRTNDIGHRAVDVYDAPEHNKPTSVFQPELVGDVLTIEARTGHLWVVYSDRVEDYDIQITGDPL